MTKTEILKQEAIEACLTPTQSLLVLNAMSEYAKQQSIAFALWIREGGAFHHIKNQWIYGAEILTTEQLYEKFISTL